MQIKVTVASIVLALSVANAAPATPMEERSVWSGIGDAIGKTSHERLGTGISMAGVGMMGSSMFANGRRSEASESPQRRLDEVRPEETKPEGAKKGGSMFGDNRNQKLNTALSAAGMGLMANGMFGQGRRGFEEDEQLQRRLDEVRPEEGAKPDEAKPKNSIFGNTPHEKLNTAMSAASMGLMADMYSQGRRDLQARVDDEPVNTNDPAKTKNSAIGNTPHEKLGTAIGAAGLGMMGYNIYNNHKEEEASQQQQRRSSLMEDDEILYVPRAMMGDEDVVYMYARELPVAPIVEGIADAAEGGAAEGAAAKGGSSMLSKAGDGAGFASMGMGGDSSSGGKSSGGAGKSGNAATNGAVAHAKANRG